MKIRAAKIKRNTGYIDFKDFLNKEFSKDKEAFVPDLELSCNECHEIEDLPSNRDSILSFLVKFKADHLSDPKAVSQGTTGFKLPNDLHYVSDHSRTSVFKSLQISHFNLIFADVSELERVAKDIYSVLSSHPHFSTSDVDSYIEAVYTRSDWSSLLSNPNKTKWRKHIGSILKRRLTRDYGKIDNQNDISKSLGIDATGFKSLITEILSYTNIPENEMKLLKENKVIQ
jgi:hypothetical protein